MASHSKFSYKKSPQVQTVPFMDAEEAWFWFIQAQQARNDGARISAALGLYPRPCEPSDIMKIVDRLYRNRCLIWDHMKILSHYGLRMMPPDGRRAKEARASKLWEEAMQRLTPCLERKGIIELQFTSGMAAE